MITRREILRRLALGGLVSPLLLRRTEAAYGLASASSQYLETGSSPISGYPCAIGGWFKLASKAATAVCASIGTSGGNARVQFYYLQAISRWYIESVNSAGTSSGGSAGSVDPNIGEWYHLLALFASATDRKLYVNGVLDMSNTVNIAVSGMNRLLIGARRNSAGVGVFFNGDAADVGFWNVANLTAGEIAALASGVSAGKVRPQSLPAHHELVRDNVVRRGPAFTAYNSPTVAAHPRLYR